MTNSFWTNINNALDTIKSTKPETVDAVCAILDASGTIDKGVSAGLSFFAGSGGDRSLAASLRVAGWVTIWDEASYYYIMEHDVTGETLTYIEGDLYRGHDSEKVDS